jgi:3-oxoadipate enol-lactonase
MGAIQAAGFAAKYPHLTDRLILADGFARLDEEVAKDRIESITQRVSTLGMAGYADFYLDTTLMAELSGERRSELKEAIARMKPEAYLESTTVCFSADITGLLPDVKARTLVLVGEKDQKTPMACAQVFADGIGDSRIRVVPGAGHLACVDAPEEFASLIEEFLDSDD